MGKMQAEEDRNSRQREKMAQTTEAVAQRYDVTVVAGSDVAQADSVLGFVSGELIKNQARLRKLDDKHHLVNFLFFRKILNNLKKLSE